MLDVSCWPLLLSKVDPNPCAGIWAMLLVAGIGKCAQLATRPEVHRGGVASLGLVLSSTLGFMLFGLSLPLLERAQPPVQAAVALLVLASMGLLLLCGLAAAVVSLAHMASSERHYERGKGQAVGALALGLLLSCLVSAGAYQGAREAAGGLVGGGGARPPKRSFEALNFRYRPPSGGWVAMDVAQINPLASVAYARAKPPFLVMIIAEDLGTLATSNAALAEVAKANLASATQGMELLDEGPYRLGGQDALRFQARARMGTLDLVYWNATLSRGGFAYQVVAWTAAKGAAFEQVRGEVDAVFAGFELIDPDATSSGIEPAAAFTSRFGYRVPARPLPWGRTRPQEWPEAEVLLERGAEAGLAIVPLALPGCAPSLRDLAAACFTLLGREYPAPDLDAPRSIERDGLSGWELAFDDTSTGQTFRFHTRVLRGPERAYFIHGWFLPTDAAARADALTLLDAIELDASAPPVPLGQLTEEQRAAHASVLGVLGDRAFGRREYEAAARAYAAACEAEPGDAGLLQRRLQALSRAERYADALAALERTWPELRGRADVLAWSGFLHRQLDHGEAARRDYAAAFAAGHRDTYDLTDFAALLREEGREEEAFALVERFIAAEPSLPASLLLARMHLADGRAERAVELLEPLARADGSAAAAHALADALDQAGDPTRALEVLDGLRARELEDAETFELRGRCELTLRWYAQARASFEEALRRGHPRPGEVEELLQRTAALLGEGSRASVSTPIEAAPPPPGWLDEARELPPGADELGACYLARLRAIRFVPGEALVTTDYLRVKVLDRGRVAELSTFAFGFDPLNEALFVQELRVLDERGEVVARGDPSSYYVLEDQAASHRKTLHVPIPGVAAGRTIELVVSRRELYPGEELGFVEWSMSLGYPIGVSAVEITGAVEGLRAEATQGAKVERSEGRLRCLLRAPPVFRWEPFAPPYPTWLPMLRVTDAGRTWEQVGREYMTEIAAPLAPADEAGELAAELLEGVPAGARLATLARWVQEKLTYRAIAFGVRAYVPNAVPQILERGYGDCKDHALLLHQLLRAAGIPSALALVSLDQPVAPEFPTRDAFDHMVVHLPGPGGGRFVDPTDKSYALTSGPIALGLARGHALLLEETPRLVRIGDYPADSGGVVVERTVAPAPGAELDLIVEERLRLSGFDAAAMRDALRAAAGADGRRQHVLGELVSVEPSARLEALEVANERDLAAPLELTLRYRLPGALQRLGERRIGRIPATWETLYLRVRQQEARRSPFHLVYPLRVRSTVRLRGLSLDRPPREAVVSPHFEARLQLETSADGDGTILAFEARRPASAPQPPERYAALVQATQQALAELKRTVVVTR